MSRASPSFAVMRAPFTLLFTVLVHALLCQVAEWQWVHSASSSSNDTGVKLALAPDGSLYQLGTFNGDSITLGDTTLYNSWPTYSRMYLAKYDPEGELLWVIRDGGAKNVLAQALHVDAQGNILVGGGFMGSSMNLGGTSVQGANTTSNTDIFLFKLDADGHGLWGYSRGGTLATDPEYLMDICTDTAGNVFALGNTHSSAITFVSGGTTYQNTGPNMLFLLKFSPTGTLQNVRTSYSQCTHSSSSVRCDEQGNVYIGGWFFNTYLQFGSVTVETAGTNDDHAFVFKFDNNLAPVWAIPLGGSEGDYIAGVAIDEVGAVYVVGRSESDTITTNGLSTPHLFGGGAFFAKYDQYGTPIWVRPIARGITPWRLDVTEGSAIMLGRLISSVPVHVGSCTLTSQGDYNACVVAFSSTGDPLWAEGLYGVRVNIGDLECAGPQDIFVTGNYSLGAAQFGTFEIPLVQPPESGHSDTWLGRFAVPSITTQIDEQLPVPFQAYPVPTDEFLYLRATNTLTHVVLFDAQGRQVLDHTANGESELALDLSALPSGVYVLEVQVGAQLQRERIVVK